MGRNGLTCTFRDVSGRTRKSLRPVSELLARSIDIASKRTKCLLYVSTKTLVVTAYSLEGKLSMFTKPVSFK